MDRKRDYQLIYSSRRECALSSKQSRQILQKKTTFTFGRSLPGGILPRRELRAKYSLKLEQNKAERAIFREKLETYLKAGVVAPNFFQVWFWDKAGFSLRVIRRKFWRVEASKQRALRKNWTLRGSRQEVTGIRSLGRINVMGGLRYHDRLSLSFFVDNGNGESFFESLVWHSCKVFRGEYPTGVLYVKSSLPIDYLKESINFKKS